MRTSKPISTINYCSRPFLLSVLDDLMKAKKISFWFLVRHFAEEDEGKDHDHLYMELTELLQTEDLRELFREFDLDHPSTPLSCQPFRSSDFENAYLYFIHDPDYLASKNMTRKYHYKRTEVITSDDDYLDEQIRRIDRTKYNKYGGMIEAISRGESFFEYIKHNSVPLNMFNVYKSAFDTLTQGIYVTQRNGRETHTPIEDTREFVCVSCGGVIPEADTVWRKGGECMCRACRDRKNSSSPAYTIISAGNKFVDLNTGDVFENADFLEPEQTKIDP